MKTTIKFILITAFLFGITAGSWAQKCLTPKIRNQNTIDNPNILKAIENIQIQTQNWIQNNTSSLESRSVVTLPVVVHIIWRLSEENITNDQVYSQMEVLNEDFRKLNSNFFSGPVPFQSLGADIEIEFCLASIDPFGNPSNGITRTQTFDDDMGMYKYYDDDLGGKDPWDIKKYINIWVCDIGDDGTLGFATPPGTADPVESDGIVIGHQYFGTNGTAFNSYPNDLGRTTTHEMGHYFNLEHLWGVWDGGCSEDDFVSDTPNQYESTEACPDFPYHDDCTFSGNGIMFNNYMDYTDDDCMTMFTHGQKMRMLAALNGPRSGLLSGNKCNTTSSSKLLNQDIFKVYPNPVAETLNIEFSGINDNEIQNLEILNILGEKMMQISFNKTISLSTSELPNGYYFIRPVNNKENIQGLIISK